jgi:hypothetical protein
MTNCKKCNSEFRGNFCSNCGHPQKLERINGRYILSEIGSVLNFQKGILYTIKELLIRPGQNIRAFISDDRNRLVKPIMFILITSLLYTLIIHFFHIKDGFFDGASSALDDNGSKTITILNWIQEHYGYTNIIMGVFIVLWLKVFFLKNQYNFFELLILLCFIMGINMLIYSILATIQGLTGINVTEVGGMIGLIYAVYSIGHFFGKSEIRNYIKGFFSYMLGVISFIFIAISMEVFIALTN